MKLLSERPVLRPTYYRNLTQLTSLAHKTSPQRTLRKNSRNKKFLTKQLNRRQNALHKH